MCILAFVIGALRAWAPQVWLSLGAMHALVWPLLPGWSHEELTRHERRAWSSLPGCSELPVDPYTEAFLDATLPPPLQSQPHRPLPRPADVLQAWRHTTLSGRLSRRRNSCADLLLVSLFEGEIAAVGCGNGSQGLLTSKVLLAPDHRGTLHAPCMHPAYVHRTHAAHMLAGHAVGVPRVQVRAARSSERCAGAALTPHTALAAASAPPLRRRLLYPCAVPASLSAPPSESLLHHFLRSLCARLAPRAQRPLLIGPWRPRQRQRLRATPRR